MPIHITPIQLIILVCLALSFCIALMAMKRNSLGRLFFAFQFLVGAVFVIFPDASSWVASKVGVGRGTDMLLYFLIMLFYMTVLVFISKFRKSEQTQTALVRELALLTARKGGNN